MLLTIKRSNRALLKRTTGQPSLSSALLSISKAKRDAPSLLDYTPTYQGFIRKKATPIVVEVQEEQEEEETPQDSFGEIPDILLPSIDRPLRRKIRLPRKEVAEEAEEEIPPKDIVAELERRKKKKQEEEKAKAKGTASALAPIPKPPLPGSTAPLPMTTSKVPPPSSPSHKRAPSSRRGPKQCSQRWERVVVKQRKRGPLARPRFGARTLSLQRRSRSWPRTASSRPFHCQNSIPRLGPSE